jgi:hypothetical protein
MAGSDSDLAPVVSDQPVPEPVGKTSAAAVVEGEGKDDKDDNEQVLTTDSIDLGVAALPKGTLDPVYEAKARVLNHAVSFITRSMEIYIYMLVHETACPRDVY